VILIVGISILTLFSAGYSKPALKNTYLTQFLWFVIGLVMMLIVSSLNFKNIYNFSLHIYLITMALLILTLIIGKEIRFTKGWISIGAINFQFSEFSKIATILFLAKYVDYHYREFKEFREFIPPFLIIFAPVFLILLQPDLGSVLVYFPVFLVMLYLAEASIKYMIYFIIIGLISFLLPLFVSYYSFISNGADIFWLKFFTNKSLLFAIILIFLLISIFMKIIFKFYPKYNWLNSVSNIILILLISLLISYTINHKLKPYQKKRLLVFIAPKIDPYGFGYNIIQSKITIGSGQLTGKGFLKGSQTQLGFLPEQTTDFIITVIGEEFGWIGMTIIMGLYFLLIYNSLRIVYNSKDTYSSLVAAGITAMLFFQIFINFGMTLGIMPVAGIPLPLLSYGGSSLVTSMICIGILNNIKNS